MKKVYLLDTNIVSEFAKERPNENVLALYEVRKNLCAISSITLQELEYGVNRLPEGRRKEIISSFILNLKNNISVIPYDEFSASICGKTMGEFSKEGRTLPVCDSQIAATAISNGMVLVTHNTDDFKDFADRAFLRVEDWFVA